MIHNRYLGNNCKKKSLYMYIWQRSHWGSTEQGLESIDWLSILSSESVPGLSNLPDEPAETEFSMPAVIVEACSNLWHCDISEGKIISQLRTLNLTQNCRAITANLKTFLSVSKDLLHGMSLIHFYKTLHLHTFYLSHSLHFPARLHKWYNE